jgi:hypothetical protein
MLKLRVSHNDRDVADLILTRRFRTDGAPHQPSVICISSRFDEERVRVERFISSVFAEQYDAQIKVEYPVIMSVRDDNDVIRAAAGFRPAAGGELFLERYLEAPIEKAIASAGQPISRRRIVEVGNLASRGQGEALFLFAALAAHLDQQGFAVVAATGTKALARQFRMTGIHTQTLVPARTSALGDDVAQWGTYYETQPRVMFGPIAPGVERLKQAFGARYELRAPKLLPRLHHQSIAP